MEHPKIRVAIADDHKQMREAIATHLDKLGIDVVIAADGGDNLLEQLSKSQIRPEICLLDYSMPDMKGDVLASKLRSEFPALKLIAMTTSTRPEHLLSMVGNGCSSYLIKSSNPSEWKKGIEAVAKKGYYFTDWMQETLLQHIRKQHSFAK